MVPQQERRKEKEDSKPRVHLVDRCKREATDTGADMHSTAGQERGSARNKREKWKNERKPFPNQGEAKDTPTHDIFTAAVERRNKERCNNYRLLPLSILPLLSQGGGKGISAEVSWTP